MSHPKHSYSFFKLPEADITATSLKKYFLWFCTFWVLIALLELGQDYISSVLNENQFQLAESLSYKLFWPLFIPFSVFLNYSLSSGKKFSTGLPYYTFSVILVLLITFIHLIVFSFFLFGISNVIHENPVTLLYLISEKLSTRLYIALSIYGVLSALYFVWQHRKSKQIAEQSSVQKTITVKNGTTSTIVDVIEIKCIISDGPYLEIHTTDKKHVILESLKSIIKNLPGNFKRIHRSTIVNIDRITKLKSRGNGDYDVIMEDDRVLRLSRNYSKSLKGILL